MWNVSRWCLCLIISMLAGCANTPSTNIHQPMTARPAEQKVTAAQNGAIFQAGQNERLIFEDRRARNVGDTLVINIVETTSASGKSGSSADHSGSGAMTTPGITGNITGNLHNNAATAGASNVLLSPLAINTGTSSSKQANTAANSGSNTFTGTISVTVVEVLPNGNLLVSGEKQVAIGQANEYIRFSGVVNSAAITGSNTVQSTQVADVHVEYKGSDNIDRSAVMSMLGRLFFSVLPF